MATKKNNPLSTSEQQKERLRQLLLQKVKQPVELAASCAQRRLWLVNQLEQPNASYNILCHINLRGSVDIPLLEKSINQLIARHSVLRTSFKNHDGEPLQVIASQQTIALPYVDLTGYEQAARNNQVTEILIDESAFIFDLGKDTLIRAKLIQTQRAENSADDSYILIIVLHHIISDGWSMGVLSRDIFSIYDGLRDEQKGGQNDDLKDDSGNKLEALKPLTVQYSDYSQRQSKWLNSEAYQQQLDYWQNYLQDSSILELPTDFARPLVKGFAGKNILTRIDSTLVRKLRALSEQQSLTLNMLLSTAFSLLLHKYSGQQDIVFGSPVANRNQSDIENLIGFFVNMQVVRNTVEPSDSFSSLLQKSRDKLFSAYENQDIPFERIVDVLQPERDRSRNPVFQVVFAMQNEVMPAIELDGLSVGRPVIPGYDVSEYGVKADATRFDLELHCWDTEDDIRCSWIYDVALFSEATIESMSQHFVQLLNAIVSQPDASIASISMLDRQQQQTLFEQFAAVHSDYPSSTVHVLFEQQAAATPDAVALVFENQSLTYSELNQKANQLAHYLQARGVKPEVMVGLSLQRSTEMVIAILAILKAGGAYLPLDPEYPASRIAFMLEDTRAPVLISRASLKKQFSDYEGELICLDQDLPAIAAELKTNPVNQLSADSLMYVIYTSGSTGQPKGVCVAHHSAVRLVKNTNYVDLKPDDVFLQFAPVAFDASTFELWGSLLNGARLVIYPPQKTSLEQLGSFIEENAVTVLFLTTALFNQMVDQHLSTMKSIRTLLSGGEALSVFHATTYLEFLEKNALADHVFTEVYGPTENTTFSTFHEVYFTSRHNYVSAIGIPISNTSAYILDRQMNLVPEGVPGELYVGGDGLARGYLNRQQLSDEQFVNHRFFNGQTVRLYRTGDLVRCRNGLIEFLDRIDSQVKVRGYRIELGEIESVLKSQSFISDAAANVYNAAQSQNHSQNQSQNKQLVAYVVFSDSDKSIEDVRNYLREKLPSYMVPDIIIALDEIPITTNGKINYSALPDPDLKRDAIATAYQAPRTDSERSLLKIWQDVLQQKAIGVFDNFFDLGGHSLMATQVISRIRQSMDTELALSVLFDHPTIAGLAEFTDANMGQADSAQGPIIVDDRIGEIPLSFSQERLWFLDQLEPGNKAYIVPFAVRLSGTLDVDALEKSLQTIIQRHEVMRTRYIAIDDSPVQLIDSDIVFNLIVENFSQQSGSQSDDDKTRLLNEVVAAEASKAFDLSADFPLRVSLLKFSDNEHVLLLTMHHIASDGWSLGILFKEVTACYGAYHKKLTPVFEPLAIQYKDFACWQRGSIASLIYEQQQDYWQQQLQDLPVLDLPADHARPVTQTYNGDVLSIRLNAELTQALNKLSIENSATLFMTLYSVYAILMQRYSGQDDIVIGTPIANRNRAELEDLIGFFVNMLVLRADLSGNPDFIQLLKRNQSMTLEAYQHQDVPFEKLVELLQPERDRSRSPLFQHMFVLQNAPLQPLELEGLNISPLADLLQATRFDLECHVRHAGDELDVLFVYNTDLFDATTIQRMLGHYETLISAVLADPAQVIGRLPMLGENERQLILEQWNQTNIDYPLDSTLQQLFETQVERTPEAIAVEFSEQRLTYRELDTRANQLAHQLQDNGVGPGILVGVFMLRSLEMVIALYATLKAGGAYVPLDPEYPQQRIAYMLEETQLPVILSQQKIRDQLPATDIVVICVDSQWQNIANNSDTPPAASSTAGDPAYVIYTSGSTGRPKGVINCHQGIVNRLLWMQQHYELQADDNILQKTPFSFDVSVWEFFWPLINGSRLVLAEPDGHKDPVYLSKLIHDKQITTLHFVPSMLKVYLDNTQPADFSSVKRVICSGEALSYDLQQQFFSFSDAELHNLYGPTEAAVDVSSWACRRDDARHLVPIGRPIANTRLYILNRQLQPVPVGVTGELYIGGVQVAQGYLGRAELTKEKFIDDPYSQQQGARLYRTGDLVRYLTDGAIEYIGRIDNQVKLRGLRIELGEIETELGNLESVKDVVVVAREDELGDQRLVAYVVAEPDWVNRLFALHSEEHVDEWQALFEKTYSNVDDDQDVTFNIVCWNSGYTGEAIPVEQMREWVDVTVERIAALKPRRVLEIGCGTGLLLYRLAADCERYVGADFSAVAQQQVQAMISQHNKLKHVELWQRSADDFSGIGAVDFDLVIINSVVQYLPNMDYLVEVLTGAVEAVAAGGQIFVGDVRSLPLLKSYHASVELHRCEDGATARELLRSIQQHVEEENELVIEPAFFQALKQKIPRLSHVEILLKHGEYINELSSYRYDVLLHVEAAEVLLPDSGQWLDWTALDSSELRLRDRLAQPGQSWLGVASIPNKRLANDIVALEKLQDAGVATTTDVIKKELSGYESTAADPFKLRHLADETGYQLELSYSGSGAEGRMDALFRKSSREDCDSHVFWPVHVTPEEASWHTYANNPLKGKLARAMIPQLKEDLKLNLPEYMVPSVFVLLDVLPLSANGKVDRRSLPMPGDARANLDAEYTAPRNEIEEQLIQIWIEVLKLEQVGVFDDFFDLGGHSLLATQVISRLREKMEINLPLSEMFGYPTVAGLAQKIEMIHWVNQEPVMENNIDEREVFKL